MKFSKICGVFCCFVYYMTLFIHTLHNNLLVNKGVLMTYRLQIFTGFIFYLYFGINQVRILVFYNYQIIVCLTPVYVICFIFCHFIVRPLGWGTKAVASPRCCYSLNFTFDHFCKMSLYYQFKILCYSFRITVTSAE